MFSLESMLKRLDNPKIYYIFYEFFYKSAVGESEWKQFMSKTSNGVRIGNDNTEAFALLLLSNNYKAWLCEEKQAHGNNLLTEYECFPTDTNPSIVEKLLCNMEVLVPLPQATTTLQVAEESGANTTEEKESLILRDQSSEDFKMATKARIDIVVNEIIADRMLCNGMKQSWKDGVEIDGNDDTIQNYEEEEKERRRKRRKILKNLRKWTGGSGGGERKIKGWSSTGHRAFEEFVLEIKVDRGNGRYDQWERTIREIYQEKEKWKVKESDNNPKDTYKANTNLLWEL